MYFGYVYLNFFYFKFLYKYLYTNREKFRTSENCTVFDCDKLISAYVLINCVIFLVFKLTKFKQNANAASAAAATIIVFKLMCFVPLISHTTAPHV